MKISILTKTTQIASGGEYKPLAPIFAFVNTGTKILFINDSFPLRPGETFSVGLDSIVAAFLQAGIEVENDTVFKVDFRAADGSKAESVFGSSLGSAHLIETFIIKK